MYAIKFPVEIDASQKIHVQQLHKHIHASKARVVELNKKNCCLRVPKITLHLGANCGTGGGDSTVCLNWRMRRSSFSNIRLAKKSLSLGLIMMWLIKNITYSDGRLLAYWLQLCGHEQLCLFCNTTVAVDHFGGCAYNREGHQHLPYFSN